MIAIERRGTLPFAHSIQTARPIVPRADARRNASTAGCRLASGDSIVSRLSERVIELLSRIYQATGIVRCLVATAAVIISSRSSLARAADLEPLRYHHPGLVVDLGVGLYAFPLPIDFDSDGDLDLVLSCPDTPFNGTYVCENPAGTGAHHPVFRAPRRISRGVPNVRVSLFHGRPRVLGPACEYPDFLRSGLDSPLAWEMPKEVHTPVGPRAKKLRFNEWQLVDLDGDGDHDLVIGVDDWSDYGWDNAYNSAGQWTHGPLHGFVYWQRNEGTDDLPQFGKPQRLKTTDGDIDLYGWPSPCFADYDGDSDLDLICGEFLDGFTYFQNLGTRQQPLFAPGRRMQHQGQPLRMDLQMILPVNVDWDADGDVDLIVGDEDGRVALVEHTGETVEGLPQFLPPFYFQQEADLVKCGALSTPFGFDWDADGDEDLVSGNTAGYVEWFENLGQPEDTPTPRWAAPRRVTADGHTIRIQAGSNGSIQGPCEAKWGYTSVNVADWDHDERPDLVINSIWGRVQWFRNVGTRAQPEFAAAQDVIVSWPTTPPKPQWTWWNPGPSQLATQWRTTPIVVDWDRDGMNDLVMLDHEGYLAFFRRERHEDGSLRLAPGERIFFVDDAAVPFRMNEREAGGSGRRQIHLADWDGDGRLDLLRDSTNADWYRQAADSSAAHVRWLSQGPLAQRKLASHATAPATVDWNRNGRKDLVLGAEDGHFYYLLR